MCGILLAVGAAPSPLPPGLLARGPTATHSAAWRGGEIAVVWAVLALRGAPPTAAVLERLAFNGELFHTPAHATVPVETGDNDAVVLAAALARAPSVPALLQTLCGPFALFFASPTGDVYVAKDRFGRRSLLVSRDPFLVVSSVALPERSDWCELEPAVYRLDGADLALAATYDPLPPPPPLPLPASLAAADDALLDALGEAVRLRVAGAPTRVAVLFSGGLDSALLAALCDAHVPRAHEIDLLNVAFGDRPEDAPDRATGRATHRELAALFPDRQFNFVAVDVPRAALDAARAEIAALVRPLDTIMDFNIAAAFTFATRDSTPARVVLLGLGADELFAGYVRHATAFRRGGAAALRAELDLDFGRLWVRNLARDDRAIAHNGREARLPFLDERVVALARSLDLDAVCDLAQPRGTGDKAILRRLARDRFGLALPATLPKRAVQFGSRVAKQHDGKTEGTTRLAQPQQG